MDKIRARIVFPFSIIGGVLIIIRLLSSSYIHIPDMFFLVLAGFLFVVFLSGAIKRWSPLFIYSSKIKNTTVSFPVTWSKLKSAKVKYNISIVMVFIAGLLFMSFKPSLILGITYAFFGLEMIVFVIYASLNNRIEIVASGNALLFISTGVISCKWGAINKVELKYGDMYITKKSGIVLTFPISALSKKDQTILLQKMVDEGGKHSYYLSQLIIDAVQIN